MQRGGRSGAQPSSSQKCSTNHLHHPGRFRIPYEAHIVFVNLGCTPPFAALGLSGIDFLGGKAALSAEKTFNSTGEDPRKVGATWKKQVGEGEIEIQGSINNRENYVGATFNMPLN